MRPSLLLVEPDAELRRALAVHLAEAGYEVRLAEDAAVAGRKLRARVPDLLIFGVGVPQAHGLEFVAGLSADTTLPLVRALFVAREEALLAAVARALGDLRREEPVLGYESAFPALLVQHGAA
jgi:DNA-binding response OmpR family regulator